MKRHIKKRITNYRIFNKYGVEVFDISTKSYKKNWYYRMMYNEFLNQKPATREYVYEMLNTCRSKKEMFDFVRLKEQELGYKRTKFLRLATGEISEE